MWTTHKHMHRELKGMEKRKHTVGLEPTISCSVGKRLIQLGYACLLSGFPFSISEEGLLVRGFSVSLR